MTTESDEMVDTLPASWITHTNIPMPEQRDVIDERPTLPSPVPPARHPGILATIIRRAGGFLLELSDAIATSARRD